MVTTSVARQESSLCPGHLTVLVKLLQLGGLAVWTALYVHQMDDVRMLWTLGPHAPAEEVTTGAAHDLTGSAVTVGAVVGGVAVAVVRRKRKSPLHLPLSDLHLKYKGAVYCIVYRNSSETEVQYSIFHMNDSDGISISSIHASRNLI